MELGRISLIAFFAFLVQENRLSFVFFPLPRKSVFPHISFRARSWLSYQFYHLDCLIQGLSKQHRKKGKIPEPIHQDIKKKIDKFLFCFFKTENKKMLTNQVLQKQQESAKISIHISIFLNCTTLTNSATFISNRLQNFLFINPFWFFNDLAMRFKTQWELFPQMGSAMAFWMSSPFPSSFFIQAEANFIPVSGRS